MTCIVVPSGRGPVLAEALPSRPGWWVGFYGRCWPGGGAFPRRALATAGGEKRLLGRGPLGHERAHELAQLVRPHVVAHYAGAVQDQDARQPFDAGTVAPLPPHWHSRTSIRN